MDRLVGTVAFLLALVVALPVLGEATQPLIPPLVGLLVALALLRMAWPGRRGR